MPCGSCPLKTKSEGIMESCSKQTRTDYVRCSIVWDVDADTVTKTALPQCKESCLQMSHEIRAYKTLAMRDPNGKYTQHECIVPVYHIDAERQEIIMKHFPTTLFTEMQRRNSPFENLTQAQRIKIVAAVSRAVCYMHSRGIAHCDIHSANILMDSGCNGIYENVVLCDMGMCTFLRDRDFVLREAAIRRDVCCLARTLLEVFFGSPIPEQEAEEEYDHRGGLEILVANCCRREGALPKSVMDIYDHVVSDKHCTAEELLTLLESVISDQ